MARQRFIWPQIWDDPDLGRLDDGARLLYIGCFSLADDDGRIIGEPVYLRSQVFRYRHKTEDEVRQMRDEVERVCRNFRVYEVLGTVYIAFLNWDEFQHPKYRKPSKFPPPPKAKRRRKPKEEAKNADGTAADALTEPLPPDSVNDFPAVPPGFPHRVGLGSTTPLQAEQRQEQDQDQDLGSLPASVAVARATLEALVERNAATRAQLGYPPETGEPLTSHPLTESVSGVLAGLGNATQQEQAPKGEAA